MANGSEGQLTFSQLQAKKETVEAELKSLGSVLDSHGVGMETPLVTRDGFPRADIDVAQIRTTRARVIRLRNDYKDIMSKMEKFLHQHFASLDDADATAPSSHSPLPAAVPDAQADGLEDPFAKVNTVAPRSPAEGAGLKAGDVIRVFGYVNKMNHDDLKRVAECVQNNEGKNILIRVSRAAGSSRQQELCLTLTPTRDWGGRGMLGCHIIPL
ncbi:26S proteasome non-ATPase regulatory subunit 9 [Drechmeria coniospora]|uniref:Probable 26S proteasome regulatory subunit p27 n=1 Tax=Drechmeria coniospora TaxID=98403 RepID=A0A151GEN0_DRECN|nr:26S proteasome non-ATPase regulatory subunit 9 [Drechmeria coniospora]KYK55536.1 26S proteasome non-ATPase regulatory subunit 9 [Drechmeria coniospora]